MIVAGCDVGSLTTKAVVMKEGRVAGTVIDRSRVKPWEAAEAVLTKALEEAGLKLADVSHIVGTGYGRERLDFAHSVASEIACHARGAKWLLPAINTIIDIGGQDVKAIKLDEKGQVTKFITNDKCASGTGRFLEAMTKVLGVELSDLGQLSKKARNPIKLASACTVWAQADVIQYLNNKTPIEDIAAGINNAMASRTAVMVSNIGGGGDTCMTGGVAKNSGVVKALEKILGLRIRKIRKIDPQLVGALGAALVAGDKQNRSEP